MLYQDSDDMSQKSTKKTNAVILDNPHKTLEKATLKQNLIDLKKMLAQTQKMLKSHNINNPNTIISNHEIDKLVNLDFENTKKEKNKTLNNTLYKNESNKQEPIYNIEKEEKIQTEDTLQQQTTLSSTTTSSSLTPINKTSKEDVKQSEDEKPKIVPDQEVQEEVTKLKKQIEDVKKTIENISSSTQ
ncbi:hypothetical protein [Sulfurospirillum arcachonense]|uniref:hypothetical protein n=1 Tax=Sulfurospirillum arcachonense TaxID=57666 RepID=UPI00046AD831|nr:hypothetical protein [Sulfurospirillum arcachonense]